MPQNRIATKDSKRLCEQSKTVDRLNRRLAVLLLRYHMSEDRIEESLKALRLTKPQARIPESSSTIKVYASYAEISRLCKMPYSTVRNHCLRAIGCQ